MSDRKANVLIFTLIGLYVLYSAIHPANPNDAIASILLNIALGIFGTILLYFLLYGLNNLHRLRFYILTKLIYAREDVRISIAYLYRIKVNDDYLLIKSRHRDYYQPIGGAYKTLPGSEKVFEDLSVRSDRLIETSNGIAKGDLRVYVKGKNVLPFLDWFDSKEDRELSPWREFCEELISENILPWQPFRYIDYKFKKKITTPIIRLDAGGLGMFVFDIYDLLPNNEQQAYLDQLHRNGNTDKYIWASEYLIQRLGHDEVQKKHIYNISPHTKWALNLTWSKN